MMRLFFNCLAASAGGGLTYLHNVLPLLSQTPEIEVTVALDRRHLTEAGVTSNINYVEAEGDPNLLLRFWREQTQLKRLIRESRSELLISTGNLALRNSSVPQILLSRNSIYTSPDYLRELLRRRAYRMWLDTKLRGGMARRSIFWADRTVAPSHAFAEDLKRWTGRDIDTIYHGFDSLRFFADPGPLPPAIQALLAPDNALRLLLVSHYNYYRNIETMLKALPSIKKKLGERGIKLFLTCSLDPQKNRGSYDPGPAAALVQELGIRDNVVELGSVPYPLVHHLHRACHIYVTAAYAETFSHHVVEAMASGMPVVAADTPLHREICADAALYFGRFAADELSDRVCQIAGSQQLSQRMSSESRLRSQGFSWKRHVAELLTLAEELINGRGYPHPYGAGADKARAG